MKKILVLILILAGVAGTAWLFSDYRADQRDRDAKRRADLITWREQLIKSKAALGQYPAVDGELTMAQTNGGFLLADANSPRPPRKQDKYVYASNPDGSVFVLCANLEMERGKNAVFVTLQDDFTAAKQGCHLNLTPEFATYVESAGISDRGASLLFAHDPQIVSKRFIQGQCADSVHGKSQVQGCYNGTKIYVIDLEFPEIIDEMQVSTAHEMLHAAFAALDEKEQKRIGSLLQAFADQVKDEELQKHLSQYRDEQRLDELHSVLGTEYRDLGPELEQHYAQYFSDRGKVMAIHAKYKQIIDRLKGEIDRLQSELDDLVKRADTLRAAGRAGEYNALVGPYNSRVEQLNRAIDRYNALTEHTRPESKEQPAGKR